MGLFGKRNPKEDYDNLVYDCHHAKLNNKLLCDLADIMIKRLSGMGYSNDDELQTINDGVIMHELFSLHVINKDLIPMMNINPDIYLQICGMNAFGTGLYLTYMENKSGKAVGRHITEETAKLIFYDPWDKTHTFSAGIKCFGIDKNPHTQKGINVIILYGLQQYLKMVDHKLYNEYMERAVDRKNNFNAYNAAMQTEMMRSKVKYGIKGKSYVLKKYKKVYDNSNLYTFMYTMFGVGVTMAFKFLEK